MTIKNNLFSGTIVSAGAGAGAVFNIYNCDDGVCTGINNTTYMPGCTDPDGPDGLSVTQQVTLVVTFDYNDGGTLPLECEIAAGDVLANPGAPSREGFQFMGWYLGADVYDFNTPVTADITLIAMWEPLSEVIVIDANPYAAVTKCTGNTNVLNIMVIEDLSDGTQRLFTNVFTIKNNSAGAYNAGGYLVYVDTKGNDQIRACYIVD
jgi:uncharacterized repeat protein (TIGR02543 family)